MGDFFGIILIRPLGLILMGIFSLVKNYGVALILFTLIVKLILLPFMYKQKKNIRSHEKDESGTGGICGNPEALCKKQGKDE